MSRPLIDSYLVSSSIGTFADEAGFKRKIMNDVMSQDGNYKDVIAIENSVEPGMPDLILVDKSNRSTFVEIKYARRGVITFKKTQLPWYRRHIHLNIAVVAYNDLTKNVHTITAKHIIACATSNSYKLRDEKGLI